MLVRWMRWSITVLLIGTLLTTSGCWDNNDFSKIIIVAAVGVDKTKDNMIQLTLQLVNPKAAKKEQGVGKGSTSGVWVETFTGETVMDAVRNAQLTTNRKPNYSQALLLVVGEDQAKEGIEEILDLFSRDHETQKKMGLLVAKGMTAEEVLNLKSDLETIPAVHISETLENESTNAKSLNVELFDALKVLARPGINMTIGIIKRAKEGNYVKDTTVGGAAVFKLDKLIGYLDPEQTKGLLFILDKLKGGIINIPNPLDRSRKLSVEIKLSKTDINVDFSGERPRFMINVSQEGNIADAQGVHGTIDEQVRETIEKETANMIRRMIFATVDLAQKSLQTDIFGLGELIWEKNPKLWTTIQEQWGEEFSQAEVDIEVMSKLKSPGLILKPVKSQ